MTKKIKKPVAVEFKYHDSMVHIQPACIAEIKPRSWNCKYYERDEMDKDAHPLSYKCRFVFCFGFSGERYCQLANAVLEVAGSRGARNIVHEAMKSKIGELTDGLEKLLARCDMAISSVSKQEIGKQAEPEKSIAKTRKGKKK